MPRLRYARFANASNWLPFVLLLAVVLLNLYRRLFLDTTDPYKCTALLNNGHWLDSPDRNTEFHPFQNWRVPGCLLHDYTMSEISSCNEDGQILFIGDTGTRQVFWAAARKIDQRNWVRQNQGRTEVHEDLQFSAGGANLKFVWDPWLNSTVLKKELRMFERQSKPQQDDMMPLMESNIETRKSVLIFVGGGLWYARHLGDDYFARFKHSVDTIAAAASATKSVSTNLRAYGDDGVGNQIVFAPVFEPLYDRLSPSREVTITPHKIQAMNKYIAEQSPYGLNVPWAFRNMTKYWPELVGDSGMHVNVLVANKMADLILNFRCNAKTDREDGFPFNKTCCSAYRRTNWVQILVAFLFLPALNPRKRPTSKTDIVLGKVFGINIVASPFVLATWIVTLGMYYCFVTDRTQIFDKSPKEFSDIEFRSLLGIAAVACLLTCRRITSRKACHCSRICPRSTPFLPREHSDELKGWMQLYMLVYRYTGASKVLGLYEAFRLCIAFYLFLSGYGHTMYFLKTKDYSLQRVASVLIRLNTLPIVLAFAMSRPYASYMFAPLVSFWFLVICTTLEVGQQHNESFWRLMRKITFSALLVTGFVHTKGVLELACAILHFLFRVEVDASEWRFHLGTDKYVVFVGMVVATLRIRIASAVQSPCGRLRLADRILKRYFAVIQAHMIAFALFIIPGFWVLARRFPNSAEYNWWMPYMSWLPIVSLVVLRNATRFPRAHHCAALAWLGRISLELYLLSHHIWLAGDGTGLLRISFRNGDGGFLSDRWRDLIVLTPIFVWLAWKFHDATNTIIAWILKSERPMEQIGLGIEGLGDHRDEEALLPCASCSMVTHFPMANNSSTQNGSPDRGPAWRLPVVVAGIWLANILNT
ncbi:Cas1p-domain-containing protein [Clathrospora elynae]|uniref:Cas1p-domain-containing protein n=1 Tax=Clathrospora elynae TaxID=706981 RepID=A0A6A5T4C0_9PLEO|nr:Cas1p-domain-containing protein [Clathrospora elynae]